jgi:hypothetical protein
MIPTYSDWGLSQIGSYDIASVVYYITSKLSSAFLGYNAYEHQEFDTARSPLGDLFTGSRIVKTARQ